MIEEVLAYSKASQSVLSVKQINMGALILELKDHSHLQSGNPNLKIVVKHTPDIQVDKTKIDQVFANLLSNAGKYSNKMAHPIVTSEGKVKCL